MLASYPASMVNQKHTDLGIPNRFNQTPSRFRELTSAAPGRGDGAAIWHFALIAAAMAAIVSSRAERRDRATNRLLSSEGGPGLGGGSCSAM